jgi:hypothetical protein
MWLRRTLILSFLAVTAHGALAADAMELAGVRIEASEQVAGSTLVLNGAGIRTRYMFKVYTAALYTTAPSDNAEAVLSQPGPKRIRITMLRDIDGNDLGKLFTAGMERNTSRADMAKSITGIVRLGELFSKRKKLMSGDTFSVDWLPSTGAQIVLNNHAEIEPIKEPEFFQALLSIWLGKQPADEDLKLALLGKGRPADRAADRPKSGR